jgi:hypothetical protein
MAALARQIGDAIGGVATRWSLITAIASFLTYVLGYLAVRFQLTALGVATDLELLDERYVFEGAKFLIYLVSAIPFAVLMGLVLAGPAWLVARHFPAGRARATRWWQGQIGPLLTGIIVSMVAIQFVMRKCFLFDNLLLRAELPRPAWFAHVLTASSDAPAQLYFSALIAAAAVPAGMVLAIGSWQDAAWLVRQLAALLFFLFGIQVLLLPVNYGVMIASRAMPRVAPDALPEGTADGANAWIIWEGKTGMTFFVRDPQGARRLLTIPHDKVTRVEIVAYDPLPLLRAGVVAAAPERLARLQSLVEMVGLTASPIRVRGNPFERAPGSIFLVPAGGGTAERLTDETDLESPIFLPGDDSLLALRDGRLVQIDLAGGSPRDVAALPGAVRLLGVDRNDPNGVLVLTVERGETRLKFFDRTARHWTIASHAPQGDEDTRLIDYLRGDDRDDGTVALSVQTQTDPLRNWSDVFIQRGSQAPENLTRGDGVSSRQPALSHGRRYVAFVRIDAAHGAR